VEPKLELLNKIAGNLEKVSGCKKSEAVQHASDMLAAILEGEYLIADGTVSRIIRAVPQGEYGNLEMWNVYTRASGA